ncbi:helix-turn-helix domain-containing protein [Bacillus swezeyi]|uniref:winged helix-turn-helix transcriptional regulator n=1 Tax=Bacillus TaxID=1386 RepID=UPI001300DDE4|nr:MULTISPECIES: helix-turn-helix domain-containing protein [Bacillus]MCI4129272.1 helix-turn-helix transcriptional regulator [Bacillus haynesii]MEC1260311.1 helix-turn-helix domain-containing protein [Bacillus swezeyi]MED2929918.1 helix-turn-helix domain-containing protein [Bacillus swezeyi]MED2964668.1 helix-turn-helix domain-containing protein [Bacillus swezeyi]MED3073051.1 helix-turn-helix domain-containing protein [Bacillus swezeyi]
MLVKYKDNEYRCSIELTLKLIGGKWKVLILWYLGEKNMRFGELKRALPQITQKMLTKQLRELEEDGIVNRFVHHQVPPKVEYSLSEMGKSLLPILSTLSEWGTFYAEQAESNY